MYSAPEPLGDEFRDRWLIRPMLDVALEMLSRSNWTWQHLGRVARYAVAFGRQLGLDMHGMMALQCGAMLHDVGKLVVPNEILDKAGPLEPDEWYVITKHSMMSGQMLKQRAIPLSVARVAQSHHEWYNGQGYPLGLEGEAIPLGARILSFADSYDAMSNDRPYRKALSAAEIMNELEKGKGTQFDPMLVDLLKPAIEAGPEKLIPRRTLHVVSEDPELFRELWFGAYPWGWELAPWPEQLAGAFPPELRGTEETPGRGEAEHVTVVDYRSVLHLPAGFLHAAEGPVLWVDAPEGHFSSMPRPLDLLSLMSALQPAESWRLGSTAGEAPLKVLVADPFKLFQQAVVRYLDHIEGLQVMRAVDSPEAYRRSIAEGDFDVAVVASDLIEGTRAPRELSRGDRLLDQQPGSGDRKPEVPSVVLVADEDLGDKPRSGPRLWEPGGPVGRGPIYIPRGAPAQVLVAAIKAVAQSKADILEATQEPEQPPWYHSRRSLQQPEIWS